MNWETQLTILGAFLALIAGALGHFFEKDIKHSSQSPSRSLEDTASSMVAPDMIESVGTPGRTHEILEQARNNNASFIASRKSLTAVGWLTGILFPLSFIVTITGALLKQDRDTREATEKQQESERLQILRDQEFLKKQEEYKELLSAAKTASLNAQKASVGAKTAAENGLKAARRAGSAARSSDEASKQARTAAEKAGDAARSTGKTTGRVESVIKSQEKAIERIDEITTYQLYEMQPITLRSGAEEISFSVPADEWSEHVKRWKLLAEASKITRGSSVKYGDVESGVSVQMWNSSGPLRFRVVEPAITRLLDDKSLTGRLLQSLIARLQIVSRSRDGATIPTGQVIFTMRPSELIINRPYANGVYVNLTGTWVAPLSSQVDFMTWRQVAGRTLRFFLSNSVTATTSNVPLSTYDSFFKSLSRSSLTLTGGRFSIQLLKKGFDKNGNRTLLPPDWLKNNIIRTEDGPGIDEWSFPTEWDRIKLLLKSN